MSHTNVQPPKRAWTAQVCVQQGSTTPVLLLTEVNEVAPPAPPPRVKIAHLLSESDRKRVERFRRKAEDFFATKLPGDEKSFLSINIEERTVTAPTEDELSAHLAKLRFFIMEGESTNLDSIRKLVSGALHRANVDVLNDELRGLKKAWRLDHVKMFGPPVDGHHLLDVWFYGGHFHADPHKEAELANMRRVIGNDHVVIWMMAAFSCAYGVVGEFHTLVRDRTDLYETGETTSDLPKA